jgi:hypothetical protein
MLVFFQFLCKILWNILLCFIVQNDEIFLFKAAVVTSKGMLKEMVKEEP